MKKIAGFIIFATTMALGAMPHEARAQMPFSMNMYGGYGYGGASMNIGGYNNYGYGTGMPYGGGSYYGGNYGYNNTYNAINMLASPWAGGYTNYYGYAPGLYGSSGMIPCGGIMAWNAYGSAGSCGNLQYYY